MNREALIEKMFEGAYPTLWRTREQKDSGLTKDQLKKFGLDD